MPAPTKTSPAPTADPLSTLPKAVQNRIAFIQMAKTEKQSFAPRHQIEGFTLNVRNDGIVIDNRVMIDLGNPIASADRASTHSRKLALKEELASADARMSALTNKREDLIVKRDEFVKQITEEFTEEQRAEGATESIQMVKQTVDREIREVAEQIMYAEGEIEGLKSAIEVANEAAKQFEDFEAPKNPELVELFLPFEA